LVAEAVDFTAGASNRLVGIEDATEDEINAAKRGFPAARP
jgi:hypothetical protein